MALTLLGIRRLLLLLLWTSAPRQPKWQVQLLLQQHFISLIPNHQSLPITFFFLIASPQLLAVIHLQYYIFIQPLPLSHQCPFCWEFIHSIPFSISVSTTEQHVRVQRTFWFKNRASTWNSWQEADNKQKGLIFPLNCTTVILCYIENTVYVSMYAGNQGTNSPAEIQNIHPPFPKAA